MNALRWLIFVVVGFFAYVLISSDRAMDGAKVGDGVVTAVTPETFRSVVLESPRPVLVEFWAEW